MKQSLQIFLLLFGYSITSHGVLCREVRFQESSTRTASFESVIIMSTDLGFISQQAKFNEGPSPQKNMASATAKDQFHFNHETKAILELKAQLLRRDRDQMIQMVPGMEVSIKQAVLEQFDLMFAELPDSHPDIFVRQGTGVLVNKLTGHLVTRMQLGEVSAKEAIEKLGLLVPEDLLFMKRDEATGEFLLIGGFLAFPTNWSLNSFKPGISISQIHETVAPTPEASAQFAKMINTVLGRLLEAPERVVRRNNWFLEADPRYSLPDYDLTSVYEPGPVSRNNIGNKFVVRTERQTLRGLNHSQTVLFTIQPMIYDSQTILADPAIAKNLVEGIQVKYPRDANNPKTKIGKFCAFMLGRLAL